MRRRVNISNLSRVAVLLVLLANILFLLPRCANARQVPDSLKGLSPQAIFDKANIQYKTKHYQKALDLYHAIEQNKIGSGALFLNMGLSYIKVDSLGEAKFYFLKAKEFPSTKKQAQQGLTYLSNRLSHKSATLPALPWDKVLNTLQNNIGSHLMLLISFLVLNIGIIIFILTWFIDKFKKLLRYSGLILTLLGVLFLLTTGFVDYHNQRYSKGVMITKQANVKEKPNNKADVVSIAYEGYTFTVDKNKSAHHKKWVYVRLSNGLYGWIPKEDIKVL